MTVGDGVGGGHLGQHQRVGRHEAQRQRRRGAAGKGAAGAVRVPGFEARQRQPATGVLGIDPVQRPARRVHAVAAGDGDRLRTLRAQGHGQRRHVARLAGLAHHPSPLPRGARVRRRATQQPPRLVLVGRDQRGARQQQLAVGAQHGLVGKGGAAAGPQHRIDHQRQRRPLAQPVDPARQHGHVVGAAQQPGLDGGRRQVRRQCRQLRVEQVGRHRLDARHGLRVLRRDGRHHRAQMHAERRRRALVGGKARAAARVVAGDTPDDRLSYCFCSCWRLSHGRHGAFPIRNGLPVTGVVATAKSCRAITPAR